MPRLTIVGDGHEREATVSRGRRLVLAIEEQGVSIGHRCGGWARCTTCRVEFLAGEPEAMTAAEYQRLDAKGLLGTYRLSCQIAVGDEDMRLRAPMTVQSQGWTDPGPDVEPEVTPDPTTFSRETLERASTRAVASARRER